MVTLAPSGLGWKPFGRVAPIVPGYIARQHSPSDQADTPGDVDTSPLIPGHDPNQESLRQCGGGIADKELLVQSPTPILGIQEFAYVCQKERVATTSEGGQVIEPAHIMR